MLTATQYAQLNTELTTDPLKLGYAANIGVSDIANAALLNATTGAGAATVTLPSITHDDLAQLIAPVVFALSGASAALQAQWTPVLQLVGGIQNFQVNAANMGMLNQLSTDFPTQLTASAITAATTRMGSRAEILFGIGTTIAWQDVAQALGR